MLQNKISLYIPSVTGMELIDSVAREAFIDSVAVGFATVAGGSSISQIQGCWVGDNGILVKESITVVYSFCEDLVEITEIAMKLAKTCREIFSQDAVALEINGTMTFV